MAQTFNQHNFNRLQTSYGPSATATSGARVGLFSAAGAYRKIGLLVVIALGAGAYGYGSMPQAALFPTFIIAMAIGIVGAFMPRWAIITGPVYAVFEGAALGSLSARVQNVAHGAVLDAVLIAAGMFIGTWLVYSTGLVRVTPRFVTMTFVATAGLGVVIILSLFGLPIPGINDLGWKGAVFGAIALIIAVFNLFVDYDYIQTAQAQRLDARGEWYAAFSLMLSLVLVYISVLRILLAVMGGRGSQR